MTLAHVSTTQYNSADFDSDTQSGAMVSRQKLFGGGYYAQFPGQDR
jgi:hypothetical protein